MNCNEEIRNACEARFTGQNWKFFNRVPEDEQKDFVLLGKIKKKYEGDADGNDCRVVLRFDIFTDRRKRDFDDVELIMQDIINVLLASNIEDYIPLELPNFKVLGLFLDEDESTFISGIGPVGSVTYTMLICPK